MMDGRLMIRATIDMKFRTYSTVSHLPVTISRCPPPVLHIRGFTSRFASAPRSPNRISENVWKNGDADVDHAKNRADEDANKVHGSEDRVLCSH